jgi:ComF family protein
MLDVPPSAATDSAGVPVFAATYYNDTSRKLVLAYKHGGRIALARLLAQLIAARLPEPVAGQAPPLLVPVPLHRWRLWQRGFNQAALLAHELARLGKGDVLVDGLRRSKRTPSLGGLGREARDAALAGAIGLHPGRVARITGRDVILIDDVFTSGATSRACLTALNEAQPASIAIACFARVEEGHGQVMLETKHNARGL